MIKKIGAKKLYIIFNILVLALLLWEFWIFGYGIFKILKYLVLLEALFYIAWVDYREKLIRNKHLLILIGIRAALFIGEFFAYPDSWKYILYGSLFGMLLGFVIFGICYLASRGGMGAGDVKLVSVLGLYLGGTALMTTLIIVVVFAALYSIINLIRKKTSLKSEMAFAPFVLLGTIVSMILGV